jgi:hypothetical protein
MLMAREAARHFVTRKIRCHRQHRFDGVTPRGAERHRLLRQQVRTARHDRVLAPGTAQVQRARDAGEPERGHHQLAAVAGFDQKPHPSKLQPEDIAHAVKSVLEMDDRGFTTELTVFATNPQD